MDRLEFQNAVREDVFNGMKLNLIEHVGVDGSVTQYIFEVTGPLAVYHRWSGESWQQVYDAMPSWAKR